TSSGASILPQSSRPPKVAFGPFEFDPALGELRKNGYKVKVPRQPAEILSALIAHPGEVVTREDLRIRLWPGITSGDFEHGFPAKGVLPPSGGCPAIVRLVSRWGTDRLYGQGQERRVSRFSSRVLGTGVPSGSRRGGGIFGCLEPGRSVAVLYFPR